MGKKVVLGMSGGIDSSFAAYLLKKEGYDVTGFTLKLWDDGSRCCDLTDIDRARAFCHFLGIPHYVIDLRKEFRSMVVDYFMDEYLNGRTPNPCVVCNKEIKFSYLCSRLKMLGYDLLATGHYSKIVREKDRCFLAKAKDWKKSQEYFLARIDQSILPCVLFPLADRTKEEVKETARRIDFQFRQDESQEICFIRPGQSYHDFIIKNRTGQADYSGAIVNRENEKLGRHDCYFKYTVGQRQGLGLSDTTPYYVAGINSREKQVIVGKKKDVYRGDFIVDKVLWYTEEARPEMFLKVKIRYNHPEAEAVVLNQEKDRARVHFQEPQFAVTPGQLAVFYKGNVVMGSGWIQEIL
ncbi:MAG: tRNA 2-thiouridine(34) synthase MnmA [bacterium]|nr:tRNA 2-thiouridine(34) synthase MnmA [bacterium]